MKDNFGTSRRWQRSPAHHPEPEFRLGAHARLNVRSKSVQIYQRVRSAGNSGAFLPTLKKYVGLHGIALESMGSCAKVQLTLFSSAGSYWRIK